MVEPYKQFIERKERQFKQDFEENRLIGMKDIDRKGRFYFIREAWTFMPQYNLKEKVFIIERLRSEKYEGEVFHINSFQKGGIEYRFGYYIVGRNGKAKDKWVWGQFCPLIPKKDFDELIKKAKEEGTII